METNLLNRTSAASTVSNRYAIVQTGDLVKRFTDAGYIVSRIQEQKYTKNSKHVGYGKQLIRLRHPSFDLKIDGLFPEIIIQNSYNGLSSFKISLGVFRLVCSNGLVAGKAFTSTSVRHVGDATSQVLLAAEQIQQQVAQLTNMIQRFKNKSLTFEQQAYFAGVIARQLVPVGAVNIQSSDLLKIRRIEDRSTDLWTVLNVIQENALRGGLRYQMSDWSTEKGTVIRNNSTRRVNAIDRNVLLNKAIWDLAEGIAA